MPASSLARRSPPDESRHTLSDSQAYAAAAPQSAKPDNIPLSGYSSKLHSRPVDPLTLHQARHRPGTHGRELMIVLSVRAPRVGGARMLA
jgi:hypothetical protein